MKDGLVHGGAVVALVDSKEKSVVQQCGDGFKVTTKSIVDILGDAVGVEGTISWDVVAYCSMNDLLEFKLDPPRGSGLRAVVATIIGLENGQSSVSVVIEKVQSIDAAELSSVTAAFQEAASIGAAHQGFKR